MQSGRLQARWHDPHRSVPTRRLPAFDRKWRHINGETLVVVYRAGPQCNGADKAALRLPRLGRPVKLMIGGVTGWLDDGFAMAEG